jgi:CRP-like cAMP-binding protein
MSISKADLSRIENRLLAALPRAEYEHLLPALKPVRLTQGTVLYEAGDTVRQAYFLMDGMASLLSITEDGSTVEIGMIGDEGMVGLPLILGFDKAPYRVMMQMTANGLELKAGTLKSEFHRGGTLHDLLLRYTHTLLCQIAQSAVCNRFHTVEKRLCRWLLISRDRVHSNTFPLTQEFIAQMLGVPRTHVTMTAAGLQRKNLIRYTRGKISIVDPRELEAAACECYRIVREDLDGFLNA